MRLCFVCNDMVTEATPHVCPVAIPRGKPKDYGEFVNAFKKNDKDKPVYALIPAEAEAAVARILTSGGKTYGDDNWQNCTTPWKTYYSATRRHLSAVARGVLIDPDSGEQHLAHAICSLLFLFEFAREGKLESNTASSSNPPPPSEGKP